jgi:hypothetical protein
MTTTMTTKKRKARKKGGTPPPTKLQLPSGQDVLVELEYRDDLTIGWRKDKRNKPLVVRGTKLKVQFSGGEVLEAVVKCAPEDNFDKYVGKRDAFVAICQLDDKRTKIGTSVDKTETILRASRYLSRKLECAGFKEEAAKVMSLVRSKVMHTRQEKDLLLPPDDRTALMKYLCPKLAQRKTKKGEDKPSPTFIRLKPGESNK